MWLIPETSFDVFMQSPFIFRFQCTILKLITSLEFNPVQRTSFKPQTFLNSNNFLLWRRNETRSVELETKITKSLYLRYNY